MESMKIKHYLTTVIFFITFEGFSQIQFNPYVPQLPRNEMANIGIYMQQLYDYRKDFIQKNVTVIVTNIETFTLGDHLNSNLILKATPDENGVYRSNGLVEKLNNKHRKILNDYLASIGYSDFANDYVFKNIMDNLRKINDQVIKDILPLLAQE
jgi:hypothetical protein